MAMYCYIWLYRVMDRYYGCVGLCMLGIGICGYVGLCVAKYGYIRLFMVMYGM